MNDYINYRNCNIKKIEEVQSLTTSVNFKALGYMAILDNNNFSRSNSIENIEIKKNKQKSLESRRAETYANLEDIKYNIKDGEQENNILENNSFTTDLSSSRNSKKFNKNDDIMENNENETKLFSLKNNDNDNKKEKESNVKIKKDSLKKEITNTEGNNDENNEEITNNNKIQNNEVKEIIKNEKDINFYKTKNIKLKKENNELKNEIK